ncbi:uncharacterized protein LOC133306302 [Gastrolobium bilobum]|uniref:uncharacterized protein LOC133306302 n=1 Tax=Gastrolobium bilobum TaxID=150636 RepID=UPI002AAFD33D|nr:uncharacterized protein LOC133306302 [Gastrolobium bilobum]
MPSGAKKRKAVKKKKEKESNINPSTNNPQGNDDLKSQDEKGSDGGEASSPAYDDHDDHRHPFNDGSKELEERDPSAAQPYASDAKSMEEVPSDVKIDNVFGEKEDSVVMIERDLKSEESSERKNVGLEHIETAKESCYGNGTSNGESLTEKNSKDENYNSFEEAIACHELVKSIDSSPSEMTLITKNAPVVETDDSAAESSVNSVKAVASVSEVENNDTGSVLLEKSAIPPVEVTNHTMKINEDNVYPLTDENATTSSLEEPKRKEYDSKVLASLSASPPFTKFTNGGENIKDSDTPECSENQHHAASAPHIVQKTSWLSCCGLFEVLSGSNR